jgi:hypothetical protein
MAGMLKTYLRLRARVAVAIGNRDLRLLEAAVQGGCLGAGRHYRLKALARGRRIAADVVRDPLETLQGTQGCQAQLKEVRCGCRYCVILRRQPLGQGVVMLKALHA